MTYPYPMQPVYPYAPPAPPSHPRSKVALVLGIVGVAGALVLVPVIVSPLAWYYGALARREADREPARWSGRGEATAGMVLGIIGTGLLLLGLFVFALIVAGVVFIQGYDSGYGT